MISLDSAYDANSRSRRKYAGLNCRKSKLRSSGDPAQGQDSGALYPIRASCPPHSGGGPFERPEHQVDALARLQPVMVQPWRIVERPGRSAIVRRGPVEPRTGMDRQRMPGRDCGLGRFAPSRGTFFCPATVLECILVLAGQAPQGVICAVPHGAVRAYLLGPLDIENGFAGLAPPSGRNCRNEPLRLNRVQPPVQCLEVGRVQAFEVVPRNA